MTKQQQVENHLFSKKTITSWDAIKAYGVTRLSAHIFSMRKRGYDIQSIPISKKDRNGNVSNFVQYRLVSKPKNVLN